MTSFSSWGEVNIAQSEPTASNLQTTWDTVWLTQELEMYLILIPISCILRVMSCAVFLEKLELMKGLSVTTLLLTLL